MRKADGTSRHQASHKGAAAATALESQMVQSVDGARTDLFLRLQIHHHGVSGIFPQPGLLKSPWVGLKHFQQFFHDGSFEKLFGNTLILSLESLIFSFPAPVILALFLNEIRHNTYKRVTQTLMYLPHFLSAVVICSIASTSSFP